MVGALVWIGRHWRGVAFAALLTSVAWGGWYARGRVERVADMRAMIAQQEEALRTAKQTADVLRAHNKRQTELLQTMSDLEKEIGASDAPLSPYLANAARRLWP